jgi:hypothetical protein
MIQSCSCCFYSNKSQDLTLFGNLSPWSHNQTCSQRCLEGQPSILLQKNLSFLNLYPLKTQVALTFIEILDLKFSKRIAFPKYDLFSTHFFTLNWSLWLLYCLLLIRFVYLYFVLLPFVWRRIYNLHLIMSVYHLCWLSLCACWLWSPALARAAHSIAIWSQNIPRVYLRDLNAIWICGSVLFEKSVGHCAIHFTIASSTLCTVWRLI